MNEVISHPRLTPGVNPALAEPRYRLRGRLPEGRSEEESAVQKLRVVPGQRLPGDEEVQQHLVLRRGESRAKLKPGKEMK